MVHRRRVSSCTVLAGWYSPQANSLRLCIQICLFGKHCALVPPLRERKMFHDRFTKSVPPEWSNLVQTGLGWSRLDEAGPVGILKKKKKNKMCPYCNCNCNCNSASYSPYKSYNRSLHYYYYMKAYYACLGPSCCCCPVSNFVFPCPHNFIHFIFFRLTWAGKSF